MKIPKVDLPREKLAKSGPAALRDEELLAILLGTGAPGKNVLALSKDLLKQHGRKDFFRLSLDELRAKKGIGPAKACTLLASFELSRRLLQADDGAAPALETPRDVVAQVQEIRARKKEHFVVLYLNARNQLIQKEIVSIGTLNSAVVHPREVFGPAIQHASASVVLAHNHPSGDCNPSREDLELTRRLASAGELLGIEVLDHLIVGPDRYLSMKERKLL